jgi:hypothetical protein
VREEADDRLVASDFGEEVHKTSQSPDPGFRQRSRGRKVGSLDISSECTDRWLNEALEVGVKQIGLFLVFVELYIFIQNVSPT